MEVVGVKLCEAREVGGSKNRRDLQRKWERSAGGRDRDERARDRENGQRGQNGRGVINEGRVQDGWMRGEREREREGV